MKARDARVRIVSHPGVTPSVCRPCGMPTEAVRLNTDRQKAPKLRLAVLKGSRSVIKKEVTRKSPPHVAPPGFEPRLKEPESSVLPLYYRAIVLREASALRKSPAELRHKISALFHHCKRRATFFSPYAPASLRKGAVRNIIMNAFNIKL